MLIVTRFVEYWARIGSEDNMTLCHRPTCRKEGVLLDYSTDGGALKAWVYLLHCVYGRVHISLVSTSLRLICLQVCPGPFSMRWTI